MTRMGIYDQIKTAFQDLVSPALHEIRGEVAALRADIRRLDQRIDGTDAKIDGVDARLHSKMDSLGAQLGHMKGELIAEIRRVDARIDGVDRELRTAIDIRERLAALEARRA
jgi:chromosome segregation ATPase